MFKISFDLVVYFLYSLTRQLTHRCLEYPCIHKVLEVGVGEVCLYKLRLFLQHGSDDVDDVIIEGYLCYLLVAIADGIREVNACGDTGWQFLNLSLYFVTVFPLDISVGVIEVLYRFKTC